jgi:hemerythrin-like domain-containing protein
MAKKRSTVRRGKKRSTAKGRRATPRTTRSKTTKPKARRAKTRSRTASAAISATAKGVSRMVGDAAGAVAARLPWAIGSEDAIKLLETDHRRLEDLLKTGEETTARAVKARTEILKTITTELTAHELIEERVLYPALKSHAEAKEIVLEGYQEHHVADVVLKELHGLRPSDERWGAKFKVFKENIEHHIEEEEGEMFKKAREIFDREALTSLGERMQARKQQSAA